FFSQERVGWRGRRFRMFKVRSMVYDAEVEGPKFASIGDARVTRVGYWLRKFRFDELPQFFNVLRGEMSMIGPRAEQVSFVREYRKKIMHYDERHFVRPGITGLAQVNYGYCASDNETRR